MNPFFAVLLFGLMTVAAIIVSRTKKQDLAAAQMAGAPRRCKCGHPESNHVKGCCVSMRGDNDCGCDEFEAGND